MSYWLATADDQQRTTTIERFDPRYWTVDFARPMSAAVYNLAADALQVACVFVSKKDLAGLIWWSADSIDHPLLAYATNTDYRGLKWSFQWDQTGNLKPLDAINGPTLTIEGRDANGVPHVWYVRLWNYATGTNTSAAIALDFDAMVGGFNLISNADPVYTGDIDRMFISLVPVDYDATMDVPIAGGPAFATVSLTNMRCVGAMSGLAMGDGRIPPHGYRTATGYDDVYNQNPQRVVEGLHALGYRGAVDHYVGESHYYALQWSASESRYIVASTPQVLNGACVSWHQAFFASLALHGLGVGIAVSFELFDAVAPLAWKQSAFDNTPALTGYTPPSTLLSPVNTAAMAYIKTVFLQFISLAQSFPITFTAQIGEPWWWSGLGANRKPCFYDASVLAAYPAATGKPVPAFITSVTQNLSADQLAFVTWCGAQLAAATVALKNTFKTQAPGTEVTLLIYTPQIIADAAAVLLPANIPTGWAWPAFDAVQLEDYEFVTSGNAAAHAQSVALMQTRLGYPNSRTDYFAGFVLNAASRAQWGLIDRVATNASFARNRYIWALPQINRDGFTLYKTETDMNGFDDILFPLALGRKASGGPQFSTTVVETTSGYESRNINWAQARHVYDAAPGIRSDADLAVLLAFFEARQGRARGFRYTDPLDNTSSALGAPVTALDQTIGLGDGTTTTFPLAKHYGAAVRFITRPVASSVLVAVDGALMNAGWALGAGGLISFTLAPPAGKNITAGFQFDVPVRFQDDQLSVSASTFRAGDSASVPIVEIRE